VHGGQGTDRGGRVKQAFDLSAKALYLTLAEGDIKRTESVDEVACGDDRAAVDVGYHGKVIGIEVLTPGEPWPLLAILLRYGDGISDEDAEALLTGYPFPLPAVEMPA
jgi:uncharacterized protein YuzE